MTLEEIKEFKETIATTIMPIAINMTEEQIKSLIKTVEEQNPDLPEGFASMLFEQIMVMKFNGRVT